MTAELTVREAASLDAEEFRAYYLFDLLSRARERRANPTGTDAEVAAWAGLTQAHAARLLCMSERQYRDFEHGRIVHPAPRFLDEVSRVLGMTQAERYVLYRLAVRRPPPRPRPHPSDVRELQSLVDNLDTIPAVVTDVAWNILAWNRALAADLHDPAVLPVQDRNAILWRFTPPADQRFPAEHANLGALVGQVRAVYLTGRGHDAAVRELVERLLAIPEADAHWQAGAVELEPWYEPRILRPPGRAPRKVHVLRTVLQHEGLRITQFIPSQAG